MRVSWVVEKKCRTSMPILLRPRVASLTCAARMDHVVTFAKVGGGGVKRNIERESASRAPNRLLSLQTGKQIGVINGQRYIARDLNQLLQRHAIYLKIPDAECGSRLGAVCARGGGLRQQRTEERKLVGEHHALRTTMEGGVAAAHGLKSPHPPARQWQAPFTFNGNFFFKKSTRHSNISSTRSHMPPTCLFIHRSRFFFSNLF